MRTLSTIGLALALAGCGSPDRVAPDQDLELSPLAGTVKVDGEPAEGLNIGFQPAEGTPGSGGGATTNAEGKFVVMSASGREGLPPGKYHIMLSWLTTKDGKPIPKDVMAADADFINRLPERLNTVEGTPYFVDVQSGENPPLDIDLKVGKIR